MGKKNKNAATWAEAKTKCRMNMEDVEMAKQLGLSPRTLIANNSSTRQELWKSPTRYWVREMYEERFGKTLSKPAKEQTPWPQRPSVEFDDDTFGDVMPGMPVSHPTGRYYDDDLDDPFAED